MAASAPSRRRTGSSSPPRWVWIAAGGLLLVAGYLLLRHRKATGATSDTSGTPGPNQTGSAAQTPAGGGSFTSHPDALQEQVQQADTTNPESPQTITPDQPAPAPAASSSVNPSLTIAGGLDPAIATAINNKTPEYLQWQPMTAAQTQAAEQQAHAATVAAQGYWTAGL